MGWTTAIIRWNVLVCFLCLDGKFCILIVCIKLQVFVCYYLCDAFDADFVLKLS